MPAHVRDIDLSKFVIQHRRPAPAVPAEKPKAEPPPVAARSRHVLRGTRNKMLLARRIGDDWTAAKRYLIDEKVWKHCLALAGDRWGLAEPEFFRPVEGREFHKDLSDHIDHIGTSPRPPFTVFAEDPEAVDMLRGLIGFLAANAGASFVVDHTAGGF